MCLRCKQDARILARQRRLKAGTKFGIIALGGGTLIALLVAGLTAIATDARSFGRAPTATPTPTRDAAQPAPRVAAKPRAVAPAAVQPVIREGRKALGDSMYAERTGDSVSVIFDTEALRTRFDWKFEGVVRLTLPIVFGRDARTALDSIPSGRLVRGGDLLRELPTRGIPLALSLGRTLHVWPITRDGRDGPIIIGYRAASAR